MAGKTLAEWLQWQESLNPAEIDLTLDRIGQLVDALDIRPPPGCVFAVAGTNGKGSGAAVLSGVLQHSGYRTGTYTSPHLCRYNERIVIDGTPVSDAELVGAFERISAVRKDIPLTYFEFGTLAAWLLFGDYECAVWVLEIGLGGRLDAVNAIDPDYAVITTIGLDHQDWLGDTIEAIANEKAGVMRPGRPVFFGSQPVPASIREHANDIGAKLHCLDEDFALSREQDSWSWQGLGVRIADIKLPVPGSPAQLCNISVALAALAAFDPQLLADNQLRERLPEFLRLPGRFQLYRDQHEWVLDVAHNPQAAAELKAGLEQLGSRPATIIVGMLADKAAAEFLATLEDVAAMWVLCSPGAPRGMPTVALAELLPAQASEFRSVDSVAQACELARAITPADGRILVCGSFRVVGPALDWLGLY